MSQQVHGVDDQEAVRGVLARREGDLVRRVEGVGVGRRPPLGHLRSSPVAVDSAYLDGPVLGRLLQHLAEQRGLGVLAVYQHRLIFTRVFN